MASAPSHASIDTRIGTEAPPAARARIAPPVEALVPDAHLNSAVAGIRGLGLGGVRVMALGPSWASPGLWSRHASARAVGPDVGADPGALGRWIAAAAKREGPLVVYPSREETVDLLLSAGDRDGVVRPFPGDEILRSLRDKDRLPATVAAAGLKTPESLYVGPAAGLHDRRFRWPVVVKPARPVGFLKTAQLVRTEPQLERLLRRIPPPERLLVQEHVPGRIVSVELVLDREGRVVGRFQQETRRTWPEAAGSIAYATSVEPDEQLVFRLATMLSELGFWGLAQVDFIESASGHFLLDVNPRFYRCLPLAVACGTNLPALWHAVAVGRRVGAPGAYRTGVTYRWLEADLVAAARGAPGRLLARAPEPRTGPAWAPGDPLPGLLLGLSAVTSRISRKLGRRSRRR